LSITKPAAPPLSSAQPAPLSFISGYHKNSTRHKLPRFI
jgi:hypothetical protein